MQTPYRLIGALVLSLALCGAVWDYLHLRTKLAQAQEQLKAAQATTKRLQATSVFRERKRAATAASAASAGHSVEQALAAQPDWANQPVPQEVQDALAP